MVADTIDCLLRELQGRGVVFWLHDGRIRYSDPNRELTPQRLIALRSRRGEIIDFLRAREPFEHDIDRRIPVRGNDQEPAPLSFAQESFVRSYGTLSRPSAQHSAIGIRFPSVAERKLVQRAVQRLAARHTVLRTRYRWIDGRIYAVADYPTDLPFEIQEIAAHETNPQAKADELSAQFCRDRFDLEKGPLARFLLIVWPDHHGLLVVVIHHSITDDWSMHVLGEELRAIYIAESTGAKDELPALPIQYADYAAWLRQWVDSKEGGAHLAYWERRIAGAVDPYWLPVDHVAAGSPTPARAITNGLLDRDIAAELRRRAQGAHATLFTLILAAFAIVLARWSQRSDIFTSIAHSGRTQPETANLIGCFIQIWVLRVQLPPAAAFLDVVNLVQAAYVEALWHLQMPYARVRNLLSNLPGEKPLRDIVVNYVPALDFRPSPAKRGDDESLSSDICLERAHWNPIHPLLEPGGPTQLFATFLEKETGSVEWILKFDGSRFSEGTIAAVNAALRELLTRAAADLRCPTLLGRPLVDGIN